VIGQVVAVASGKGGVGTPQDVAPVREASRLTGNFAALPGVLDVMS
jgi:hypothetical protein